MGFGLDGFAAIHANGADDDRERGKGVGPDHAAGIVVLFDGRRGQARDADAVAAHFEMLRLAIDVEEGGVHGAAVLGAEVEHVAHFNAALNRQLALAAR